MKIKQVKKWLLRIIVILFSVIIVGVLYINYELKHMYGGYTKVVDNKQFNFILKTSVITNVNVLSQDGSHFIENQIVLIDQGKIISINRNGNIPEKALIIDGQGKYLIPGLIDSHVHLWQSENDLLLYIANGVTHISEMMGSAKHLKWRQEINEGKRLGPKMFVASNKIQSFNLFQGWFMNWMQGNINLRKTDNAISTLQSLSNDGYDAVKIGSFLNKEHYKALNIASNKMAIPLIGHLPLSVNLNELWNSNQKGLTHLEEIVKALKNEFGKVTSKNKNIFLQYVRERSNKISDNLIKKNIAISSTLWLSESFIKQKFKLVKSLKEVKLLYVNPGLLEGTVLTSRALGWLPEVNLYRLPKDVTTKRLSKEKEYWTTYAEVTQILVDKMTEKGVKILAGTDTNIPIVVPGFSLHDELNSLVKAGMTPSQALLSSTATPAEWMKKNIGKIKSGYSADLVLLNNSSFAPNKINSLRHKKT